MQAIIWSRYECTFCDQAKALMAQRGIKFEERKIGDGWTTEELLEIIPNAKSVPQIFIEGRHIGGYNALQKYLEDTAGGFGEGQL